MTEPWVLDCSAAAAFLLNETEGAALDALILAAADGDAAIHVPALFWFELLNVVVMAERRGRISGDYAAELRRHADSLPVTTAEHPGQLVRRRIHDLARRHGLTAYDASYLELADRLEARLRTFDPHLLRLRPEYAWIV